jgi:dCTP deaminase
MLSDSDIINMISSGDIVLQGFKPENLTPNGYDLTIGEILIPSLERKTAGGDIEIPPMTWFLIGTEEIVELKKGITGQLWIRTSWARKGVIGSFGKIDAGFRGNLTLSAFNASAVPLKISTGQKFAQIVFMSMLSPSEKGYGERSGNYQDQRGITLEAKKLQ